MKITRVASALFPLFFLPNAYATELPDNALALAQITCKARAKNTQLDQTVRQIDKMAKGRNPAKMSEMKAKLSEAKQQLNEVANEAAGKYQSLTQKTVDRGACQQLQNGDFQGQAEASRFARLSPNDIQKTVCKISLQKQYQVVLANRLTGTMKTSAVSEMDIMQLLAINLSGPQDDLQTEINVGKKVYLTKTGKALNTQGCPKI